MGFKEYLEEKTINEKNKFGSGLSCNEIGPVLDLWLDKDFLGLEKL